MAAPLVSAMLPGGKPIETLANVFSVAHGQAAQSIQTSLVQQVWAGIIDPSQLSIRVNGADASILAAELQKAKGKQSQDTQMWLAMMGDLERAANDLAALNERVRVGSQSLKEKYGGIEGVAETFLTEDERHGLTTEEEIYQAMADKYLNEDGTLKSGAEELDPEVIEFLQVFQQQQKQVLLVREKVQEIEESGRKMTVEDRAVVDDAAREADGGIRARMAEEAVNVPEAVDVILEVDIEENAQVGRETGSGGFSLPGRT